jgi:hypothetical protein
MRSLPARHIYAASVDTKTWCRLSPAPASAALIHPGRETRTLVPGCTDRPADLLAIVDGLDADHPDIPRHAIDITVRDTVGSHNLFVVRKGLASPGPGAAGSEGRKRKEFIKKMKRGAAVAPGCSPDFCPSSYGF